MFRAIGCGCVLLLLECGVRNVDAQAPGLPAKPAETGAAAALVDRHGDPLPQGAIARLGTERFRHGYDFVDAAFSADGKQVVSVGSWWSGVTVWDAATGKKLHRFVSESLRPLRISPNGKFVVAEAKQGKYFCILDALTGKELHHFDGLLRERWYLPPSASAFSSDGKFFAVVDGERGVRLCEMADGADAVEVTIPKRGLPLAFSPDGKNLAMGVRKGVIEFRYLPSGEHWKQLTLTDDWVSALAISPDAKSVAFTTHRGSVQCCHAASGKERWSISDMELAGANLAYSPDDTFLAVTAHYGVRILRADTGKIVAHWPVMLPGRVAFSPNGKTLLASGENSAALRFWDTASSKEIIRCPGHQGGIAKLAFAGDGERVFSASFADQTIRTWSKSGIPGSVLEFGPYRMTLSMPPVFSESGFAVPTYEGDRRDVEVWRLESGQKPKLIRKQVDFESGLAYSRDGKVLAFIAKDGSIQVWDETTDAKKTTLHPGLDAKALSLALTPSGTRLAASISKPGPMPKEFERTIRIWDLTTNKVIRSIKSWGTELIFAPNDKWLATIGPTEIWDIETGQVIAPPNFRRPDLGIFSSGHAVAFSSDSRFHAWAVSHDGVPKIHIFESATGRETGVYYDGAMHITAIAFSLDGRRLASGHVDSTILIWDLERQRKK